MARSINERFLDFQVAQQVRWLKVGNRDVKEALKLLKGLEAQVAAMVNANVLGDERFTTARLNALQAQTANLIDAWSQRLTPMLEKNNLDAMKAAADLEADAFKRMLPAGLDVTTPNPGVLQGAATSTSFQGATTAAWAKDFGTSLNRTTWTRINEGILAGETSDQITRGLIGTRSQQFKDGALQPRRRGLETLVRTSVNHSTNQGRQQVWEANKGLISSVQWVSTLDTRTTPICQQRDGKVGPVDQSGDWVQPSGTDPLDPPFARPPAHPNCRSTTVAITKSWKELGLNGTDLPPATRASMNGQVPASTTYYEWLRRQNPSIQKEVLGPTRFDMWKEGGVKPERFVNDKGDLLTLDQITGKATPPARITTAAEMVAYNETTLPQRKVLQSDLLVATNTLKEAKGNPDLERATGPAVFKARTALTEYNKLAKKDALEKLYGDWDISGSVFTTKVAGARMAQADEFVRNLVHPSRRPKVSVEVAARHKRPYYVDGQIHVNKNTTPGVISHEIIHAMEDDPAILKKTRAFLNKRTAGESPVKYQGEDVLKDKWTAKGGTDYTGKLYREATEVLTTGVERLIADPVSFATRDPEFFDFVMGIFHAKI